MQKVTFNQIMFLVCLLAVGGGVATGKLSWEALLALVTWFAKSPLAQDPPPAPVLSIVKKDGEQ